MARSPLQPERIRSDQAAAILGIATRNVQAMALRGELPNAAKIGGVWTFDEAALRGYIAERVQQPSERMRLNVPQGGKWISDRKAEKSWQEARARLRKLAREGR